MNSFVSLKLIIKFLHKQYFLSYIAQICARKEVSCSLFLSFFLSYLLYFNIFVTSFNKITLYYYNFYIQ